MRADTRRIVKEMVQLGCTVEEGSKHTIVRDPQGKVFWVVGRGNGRIGWELERKMKARLSRLRKEQQHA